MLPLPWDRDEPLDVDPSLVGRRRLTLSIAAIVLVATLAVGIALLIWPWAVVHDDRASACAQVTAAIEDGSLAVDDTVARSSAEALVGRVIDRRGVRIATVSECDGRTVLVVGVGPMSWPLPRTVDGVAVVAYHQRPIVAF